MRIRGTGVYTETDPEQTYFCTCYGVAEVAANNDPSSKETVVRDPSRQAALHPGERQGGREHTPCAFS